jgi:Tfp pilus assembly protein PilF
MRKTLVLLLAALVFLPAAAARAAEEPQNAKAQVDFGIAVAQRGLWKEALYRWQKAVELDPGYAAAWNNLAIAYEHAGNFPEARKAYEKALALDSKNLFIKQNYELFKEINDRANRPPAR